MTEPSEAAKAEIKSLTQQLFEEENLSERLADAVHVKDAENDRLKQRLKTREKRLRQCIIATSEIDLLADNSADDAERGVPLDMAAVHVLSQYAEKMEEINQLKQRLADVLDPTSSVAGPLVLIDDDGDTCYMMGGFFVKAKVIKQQLAEATNQKDGG